VIETALLIDERFWYVAPDGGVASAAVIDQSRAVHEPVPVVRSAVILASTNVSVSPDVCPPVVGKIRYAVPESLKISRLFGVMPYETDPIVAALKNDS
jgi:hypothetical protein